MVVPPEYFYTCVKFSNQEQRPCKYCRDLHRAAQTFFNQGEQIAYHRILTLIQQIQSEASAIG